MADKETSRRVASEAGRELADPKTPKPAKEVAGSALSQTRKKQQPKKRA